MQFDVFEWAGNSNTWLSEEKIKGKGKQSSLYHSCGGLMEGKS
jgi:hypothetical protein